MAHAPGQGEHEPGFLQTVPIPPPCEVAVEEGASVPPALSSCVYVHQSHLVLELQAGVSFLVRALGLELRCS